MDAGRPDFCSHSRSAWSRGVSENPPAAAPHRMLQLGTSLASTVHSPPFDGGGVVGSGVGVPGSGVGVPGSGCGSGSASGVATVTFSAGRSVLDSDDRKRATSVVV